MDNVTEPTINLEAIVALLPGHVYWKDRECKYLGCNLAQLKSLNLNSQEEIIGKTDFELPWPKGCADVFFKNDMEVMRLGQPIIIEELCIVNGEEKTVLSQKQPLKDKDGNIIGVLGISLDISQQKKAQEKLKDEKNIVELTLENIIACLPGYVYWLDENNVFLGCNDIEAASAGLNSREEIVGKTNYDMPWREKADEFNRINNEVMRTGREFSVEEPCILADGTEGIFLSKKIPLRDHNKKIIGTLGISFDITRQKELERALIAAKELAEAASEAKTEFMENMRHDIRTPLTGIVGFAQIIKEETKDKRIAEYADNLAASGETLLEFLNEILDAVRLTSGDLPLNKRKFNLKERLEDIVRLSMPKAHVKRLNFKFKFDEKIPTYLMGDSKRIHRLILELVSNALNFTDRGQITLSADIVNESERDLVIKFEVADTGIGMPLDRQNDVFTRFKRLTPSYQGIYKGTGLGLSVVKQFIDDLDGEIYLESEPGAGTTFTCAVSFKKALIEDGFGSETPIHLPVKKSPEPDHASIEDEKQPKKNLTTYVLLVEDQFLAAKMAKIILESLNCQVDIAENGRMALQKAAAKKYDLIFMDVGLPDLDGCEVTHRIRLAERNDDSHVPILGLTGHIDVENKQRCISAGMDAVLSKPLAKDKAVDLLNAFIPARSPKINLAEPTSSAKNKESNFIPLPGNVLDLKSAMQLLGGKKELAIEMLEMLVASFPEEVATLNQAYAKQDMQELEDLTHKMKGAACYCGTPRFKEACERLEMYLHKEGKPDAEVVRLFDQLIREIEAVKLAYSELKHKSD